MKAAEEGMVDEEREGRDEHAARGQRGGDDGAEVDEKATTVGELLRRKRARRRAVEEVHGRMKVDL